MRKLILATLALSLILALTACGSSTASAGSTSLPLEGQLLIGTLKLEDTDLAVTSAQAADLLPLWEALQSLSTSSITAAQEVDAVIAQIKTTMSAAQLARISAMKLTQDDLDSAAAEAGSSADATGTAMTGTVSVSTGQSGSGSGAPAGGDIGSGMPPSGSSDVAALTGAAPSSSTQATGTQTVTGPSSAASNQVPAALLVSLIDLLQKKTG